MNRKLHELGLDEEILSKVAPFLIESSDSESFMSGDSSPLQVDELIDSDTSASSSSDSETDFYLKKINVLTKDQEIFLELVKHISDPNLQKEYLDKLLKTLDFNKAETSKVPIVKKSSYDLTEILDKKKTKKTIPNIQYLQKEIKEIKSKIRELKEKQKGEKMPKQSSSFSSPREIKGSSSPEVLEEELATDVSDRVSHPIYISSQHEQKQEEKDPFPPTSPTFSAVTENVSKTSQKLVQESKSDFAKAIREQLDRIEATSSSFSKIQIAPDTPQSNNMPSALNQSRYNASSVYEWNIDGMSEYNILGLLQQMTMAANAYKTQLGTSDKAIADILIAGFTGQLKGWWDHLLTKQQQLEILNAIQIDENGAPILDEFNNPIQDAIATLILTISLHFIGDPSHLRDKNAELLHNLRCRKLSEFQDYKTTFFTRLFLRDDANHITWKEKFLAGLPTLLGEKVRNFIKVLYDNRISYDELTYGELVSFVSKEGLMICQDLKLHKRLKWELRKSKQDLGSFCKQFNYDPFKTSTSKDCNGECSSRPHKRHYKSKSYRKPFQKFRESSYKKPQRPYKKPNFSKKKEFKPKHKAPFNYKEAICHKCGIKGHTAKYCRMNRKLHELGLDEEILSKVAPLLIESSDSESSMSGDSDPLQVDELIDSNTSASSSSDSETDFYLKKITVLTKDQETFLELVKHISDPNL
ncbi:hypothetical protein KPL70_023328 [Citrus sinensis]|nr:hypothetical protein KPL70_023328 [Citrus sinensis]